MLKVLVLLSFLAYAAAQAVEIESCMPESEPSKLSDLSMTVTDCDNPERCVLIRNTTHTIGITFTSQEDTQGLAMFVYGKVLRVRVPYVRNVDICPVTNSTDGTTCVENTGLRAGRSYTIVYPFYIRSQFPEWKVPVEFEVHSGGSRIACIRVQVEIKCNVHTEPSCSRDR